MEADVTSKDLPLADLRRSARPGAMSASSYPGLLCVASKTDLHDRTLSCHMSCLRLNRSDFSQANSSQLHPPLIHYSFEMRSFSKLPLGTVGFLGVKD